MKLRARTGFIVVLACALSAAGRVDGGSSKPDHEWASLVAVDLDTVPDYTAWKRGEEPSMLGSFPDLRLRYLSGRTESLHSVLERDSNRAVLIVFLASWCSNSSYEAPRIESLHEMYGARGLRVIGRFEYSSPESVFRFREEHGLTFPIALGSTERDETETRVLTSHFAVRRSLGDERKWGTPMSVLFLEGDPGRPYVAAGEMIPGEIEELLDSHLQ
jgi:thiol-disulfide isomerase/thioredoxin